MTTSIEMILIGGVVKILRDRHSWTGETHIQKSAYIAKVLKKVPFESEFVLYKHGPYSFDMNKSLSHMRGRGLLITTANPGYGPTYKINEPLWQALNKASGDVFSRFEESLIDVCRNLANKNVSSLERVATAVFLRSENPDKDDEFLAREMVSIKPHILIESARVAFIEADKLN